MRMMSSDVTSRDGHSLTLVNAHVLPEIIVTAKVLSTSFDGTLVRCKWRQCQAKKSTCDAKKTHASRSCG